MPSHSFTPAIIDPRKPFGPLARRAGWQRCNILIGQAPLAGRIPFIRTGLHIPKATVLEQWRSTRRRRAVRASSILRETKQTARGWLLAVMNAVEAIGRPEFTRDDVYAHEANLSVLYPGNNNARPKIRQQLQMLRDRGWLAFNGRGTYRRT